jgi:hypothetical protein
LVLDQSDPATLRSLRLALAAVADAGLSVFQLP